VRCTYRDVRSLEATAIANLTAGGVKVFKYLFGMAGFITIEVFDALEGAVSSMGAVMTDAAVVEMCRVVLEAIVEQHPLEFAFEPDDLARAAALAARVGCADLADALGSLKQDG
jgi:hypothetical protein